MWRLALIALAVFVAGGCEPFTGLDHPTDQLRFPASVVADPAGDYVYVVNTNFDLAFVAGNVVAVDVETHKIVPESSVQVNTFGAEIAVHEVGGTATGLYVTSREGNTLTWIEVSRDDATGSPRLACSEEGAEEGRQPTCNGGKYVFGGLDEELHTGADPFGVAVVPPAGDQPGWVMTVAFQGTMAVFRIGKGGRPEFKRHVNLTSGSYGVAVHPVTRAVYATSKLANVIFSVDVDEVAPAPNAPEGTEATVEASAKTAVVISNPTTGRDFGRGVAFNEAGTMAFVAYRTPPSLMVVDTTIDDSGVPANRIISAIPLGDGPAAVSVARSGSDGRELVYVTLYNADQVAVIDPSRMEVLELIEVGDGPFDITVIQRDGLKRAYVTLFEDHTLGVIELDPKSPFYHQEIARIP